MAHIIIPNFKVSQMVNRFKRKIRSKTVREMLHWSHYGFRQKLKCKGEELSTHIHDDVTEEYTSKGCPMCGIIHETLGGGELFVCRHCDYICDRDRGAARAIYLKNIEACVGVFDLTNILASN